MKKFLALAAVIAILVEAGISPVTLIIPAFCLDVQ
jgi:hypothetical protein